MDPLSVTASVVGLLGAAAKVYGLLEFVSSAKNAPTTLREAQLEVKHVEIILQSFQRYVLQLDSVDVRRRRCIQMDDLIIALSDAMLVFSDFESLLSVLTGLTRLRAAVSWHKFSKQISEYIAKTQRNKTTLMFMLSILQCESDLEVSQNQKRLQESIENILADNAVLRLRMGQMHDSFDAQSQFTRATPETDTIRPHVDDGNDSRVNASISAAAHQVGTFRGGHSVVYSFAFEDELEKSWVYMRNRDGECDRSFVHSEGRSHAWSCLTGYNLADISILSVICMPLTRVDVVNGKYYNFDLGMSSEETPPESVLAHTKDDKNGDSEQAEASALAPSEVQSCQSLIDKDYLLFQEHFLQDLDNEDSDIDSETEHDFLCAGCGKILEEGKAYELAERRWHLTCFRCGKCNSLLDTDSNLLLLWDGSFLCNDCSYSCVACGNKIEDKAIITGPVAYCHGCFRCTNCKRQIEDLRYGRTNQGISCMHCYKTLMARRKNEERVALTTQREIESSSSPITVATGLPTVKEDDVSPDQSDLVSEGENQHPPGPLLAGTRTRESHKTWATSDGSFF